MSSKKGNGKALLVFASCPPSPKEGTYPSVTTPPPHPQSGQHKGPGAQLYPISVQCLCLWSNSPFSSTEWMWCASLVHLVFDQTVLPWLEIPLVDSRAWRDELVIGTPGARLLWALLLQNLSDVLLLRERGKQLDVKWLELIGRMFLLFCKYLLFFCVFFQQESTIPILPQHPQLTTLKNKL